MKLQPLLLLAIGVNAAPRAITVSAYSSSSPSQLRARQVSGLNFSAKDIKSGTFECKQAALIFARGTGEPGNLGAVVGPGLATQLKRALNNSLIVQGADYTTNFSGSGATEMVRLSKQVTAKCGGKTKIVLGGYSQGAMQVHQALKTMGSEGKNVRAAVTFGDPYSSAGFAKGAGFNPESGLIVCAGTDFVCGTVPAMGGKGGGKKVKSSNGSHLAYSSDGSIATAVQFIVQQLKAGDAPAQASNNLIS